jgi:outer membrane protein TolC
MNSGLITNKMLLAAIIACLPSICRTQPLTLEAAIRLGLQNRPELQAQQLQIQLAAGENDKIKAKWMPQISGTADVRWNTQLQTSVLPIGKFGIPGVPTDEVRTLQMGLPFNNALGLQLNQKIYDPSAKNDRMINDAQTAQQQNSLEQIQINLRYDIAEAYYAVLFNQERIELARQALDRAALNLQVAQNQLKDGTALPNDVDRFRLDVSNARFSLSKAQQDLDLSLDNLRYRIRVTPESPVELADKLAGILQSDTAVAQARADQRVEIRSEQTALQLNALNEKKELLRHHPTVSGYANYTLLQLHDKFNPFASGTWFPYNYIGVKADIPIYDGRQSRLAAADFGLRQQVNRANLEKIKADIGYELKSQLKNLQQARLDLLSSRDNVTLARKVFETDRFRFEKGVLKQTDLKNSEFSLQSAENNYLSSVYNFLIAHLKYKKAAGIL